MENPTDVGEGWEQLQAGVALIRWSNLVRWDHAEVKFIEVTSGEFEMDAYRSHPEFGRLISWLVFAVGSEYLLKGVCLLRELKQHETECVWRPPSKDEDLDAWAQKVREEAKKPKEKRETIMKQPTFGILGGLPLAKMVKDKPREDVWFAGIELLRDTIRNRDAHKYNRNVRESQFYLVPKLFIPTLNAMLSSLDPEHRKELRSRIPADQNEGQ